MKGLNMPWRVATLTIGVLALASSPASADENGASVYLLGSGGPGAAVLPPVRGVFLDNTTYIYSGSTGASADFNFGGNLVADVNGVIVADFVTLLAVPSTDVLGGTLAMGVAIPVGAPIVDASAVLTGPNGRQLGVQIHDSTMVFGDPITTAELGWKTGDVHIALSTFLNIPVGDYRPGELANLAFHRWAGDISAAASWHNEASGWDVSGKLGFTINGHNEVSHYNSGNDFHLELAAEKTLSKKFSLGLQGYYFQQISDDGGSGAKLGAYRGRVFGAGGTVAYSTILGRSPSTFRLRVFQEFGAENRMEGTGVMFSLTLPLKMILPKAPTS